ncbi:hypothetical protein P9207_20110 [Bacillus licheniformis]|nr:hypothetical protein [Bacillus licheniformis]
MGIILVVLGHTPTPDWLKTFIFAFHMPLFFFLSGLVYHDGNMTFTSFLLKKNKDAPFAVLHLLRSCLFILGSRREAFYVHRQFGCRPGCTV